MMMRIGLNLLHARPEIGGGWNYIANLIAAINDQDSRNHYVAFVTRASESLVPAGPKFTIVRCSLDSSVRFHRVLYENTVLQVLARSQRLDCMHWFANTQALVNQAPSVVTVYDLQPFLGYAQYSWAKRNYLRSMMRITAKYSPMLLPMSQATADELHTRLGVESARMTVIPVIIERLFQPMPPKGVAEFKAKYRLPERFWLYVAHGYPHKNHARLLQGYHHLKVGGHRPWPLVLRGDKLETSVDILSQVEQLGLKTDVIFLPQLERGELPMLYSAAGASVFPSLYEGCGIPTVEAMACGCPLVASSLPPIKEFVEKAALYFDPLNMESIAEGLLRFENNIALRSHYRQAGLVRVAQYRAEVVIPILLEAYRRAVGIRHEQ